MNAQDYWRVFVDSGIPEYYVLYNRAKKMEESYVPEDTGSGNTGMSLQ